MRLNKKSVFITIFLTLILVVLFLPGYNKLHRLREQNSNLEKRIQKLEKENKELYKKKKKLSSDIEYIEKVAREEMGFAKEGEIIYKIEE